MSAGPVSIGLKSYEYEPGQMIEGLYRVELAEPRLLKDVTITIGWSTEGKGTTARGAEHREVREAGDHLEKGTFRAVLPASPLSYDGSLIKICWVVRVRVGLSNGKHLDAEEVFQLGHVREYAEEPGDT